MTLTKTKASVLIDGRLKGKGFANMSEKSVKIKIGDRGVGIKGTKAKPGTIHSVSEKDAKYLIATGKAVPHSGKAPTVDNKEKDVEVIERNKKKK